LECEVEVPSAVGKVDASRCAAISDLSIEFESIDPFDRPSAIKSAQPSLIHAMDDSSLTRCANNNTPQVDTTINVAE
jgi:hypothetical protein